MPIKKVAARRKPKALRKDAYTRIRLTEAQKRTFEDAAHRAGLDLSSWLRMVATRAAAAGRA